LHIESTEKTPEVYCLEKGLISIEGISIPENAFEYYSKILKWLEDYLEGDVKELKVKLYFTYCNTSTYQMLGAFFRLISDASSSDVNVDLEWYYDEGDMDMEDVGRDYAKIYNSLNFKVLEVK
jgi:hypothetical protein